MTSVPPHIKVIPAETAYFVNLGDMRRAGSTTNASANGGTVVQLIGGNNPPATTYPSFSTATWVANGGVSSFLQYSGGAVFRDLGKTIVSAARTFRKVQLVVSTFSNGVTIGAPVASQTGNQPWSTAPQVGEEYYTGYIELPGVLGAASGAGSFAPVARLG